MSEKHLHIVSFDIPYPPNYGGVIDVFYKIRALYNAGVKVHLHCFEYHRKPADSLKNYCEEVLYYPRKNNLLSAMTHLPYIVFSRRNKDLLKNLLKDTYPILFEGLHSCYYLDHPALKNRIRVYRESNIEHDYYFHLSKAERNLFRKMYFYFSGIKLRAFQNVLRHATLMLTVSKQDNEYLRARFQGKQIEYLPSFHHDDEIRSKPGKGNFILYQGNLSVGENRKAVEYLAEKVAGKTNFPFIVAGMNPPDSLKKFLAAFPNITLIENPSEARMFSLIQEAQVNLMITFQSTGLKLKLLHALFNGRHCLVNPNMIHGTELGPLCETANSARELQEKLTELMNIEFTPEMTGKRKNLLLKMHSNTENCKRLVDFVYL